MDHIRVIQEVVDAHKEDMPTGVTTRVMEECQKAYNELPALYKLVQAYVDGGGLARAYRACRARRGHRACQAFAQDADAHRGGGRWAA